MRLAGACFAALLAVAGGVSAQGYRVVPDGGPLTLTEDVAAAAEEWNILLPEGGLEESVTAENTLAFGDPELMGPDTVSLTLVREGDEGLEILFHPELYRTFRGSLSHELGLILGLSPSDSGVMDPLLEAGAPRTPGETAIEALAGLRSRVPGDLDGDGTVGIGDLVVLAREWGRQGVNLTADLDGNGRVGDGDLEAMRELYEFREPAAPQAEPAGPDSGTSDGRPETTGGAETSDGIAADPAAPPDDEPAQDPDDERADEPSAAPPDSEPTSDGPGE